MIAIWLASGLAAALLARIRSGPLRWFEIGMFVILGPLTWLAVWLARPEQPHGEKHARMDS